MSSRLFLLGAVIVSLCCSNCGGNTTVYPSGPPAILQIVAPISGYVGESPLEGNISVSYVSINAGSFKIDWGDGGGWVANEPNQWPFVYSHLYAHAGTYTIHVKAQAGTKTLEDSFTVTITAQELP